MNQEFAIESAKEILKVMNGRGKGNEEIFLDIAKVWYHEQAIICRTPNFALGPFGRALGLSNRQVANLRVRATESVEAKRRAETRAKAIGSHGNHYTKFILIDGTIHSSC